MTGTFVFIVRYVRSLLGSKDVHLQDLYHRLSNPERSTIRSTLSPSCPCSAFLPALHTFQGRAVRLRFHDCAGSCWARSYRRRDAVNQCHRVGRRLLRIIIAVPVSGDQASIAVWPSIPLPCLVYIPPQYSDDSIHPRPMLISGRTFSHGLVVRPASSSHKIPYMPICGGANRVMPATGERKSPASSRVGQPNSGADRPSGS